MLESHRERLGEDLDELQATVKSKVKETTDLHTHYKERPYWFLGAAFAGGVVVASLFGKSKAEVSYATSAPSYAKTESRPGASFGGEMHSVVDELKGALIGFGVAKLKGALSDMIPGLGPHLDGRHAKNRAD